MNIRKQGLQKLTDSEKKVNAILDKSKVEQSDVDNLTSEEMNDFCDKVTSKLNKLTSNAFDQYYHKVENILPADTKNQIWERNHNQITWAISVLMQDCGCMPTTHEIATKSELSRQTIHKHLKEYANEPKFLEIKEQFRFMTSKVLARVFKFAVTGDMRAAKLYFDVTGNLGFNNSNITHTQNNYIQINQVKVSQETIKQLNPEQLNQIEAILRNVNLKEIF